MFCNVVAAMAASASRVRKAWWAVMITLGKVSNRARTSSCKGKSERSSKNSWASSSYTSSPR
ncbi:hypothetical protein D3C81_2286280 [compost metagenome]